MIYSKYAIKLLMAYSVAVLSIQPVLANKHSNSVKSDVLTAMQRTNETMGKAVVAPVMDRFVVAASQLKFLTSRLESAPTEKNLSAVIEQFYSVIENREMLRAFEFGPAHSLGYTALLDTPTDEAGITELLSNEQLFVELTDPDNFLLQSLQGLSAIEVILENWQSNDLQADYNLRQRQFLTILADRVFKTALAKKQAWFEPDQEHAAFNSLLKSAGTAGNPSYQTVEQGGEEWVRSSINALAALMEEGLVDVTEVIEGPATQIGEGSLRGIRGVINSVAVSYSGEYFSALDGDHLIADADADADADTAPVSPPTGIKPDQPAKRANNGISHWVSKNDPDIDDKIDSALMTALRMSDSLLASPSADSAASEIVQVLTAQIEQVVELLESQVLPVTQAPLTVQ